MTKQMIGVNFSLKFEEIEDINPSFARARVAIAYAGRNRNKSCIKKEVFEEALPSLFYCPVVGRYDPEKDDFGGHDIRVARDKNGNLEVQNATVPFGVVFADNNVGWETVTEDDGTEREYLFCNVILWKRQYGYERLASQDTWNQSMEIHVDRYVVDADGYCDIEKMYYEALCILGNDVEPCFESAMVQLSTETAVANYRLQFSTMLEEMRESPEFKDLMFNFEGGKNELIFTDEVRDQILNEFGLTLDDVDFEIASDMTEEQFRAEIEAMMAKTDAGNADSVSDTGSDCDDDGCENEVSFSATYIQRLEALRNALDPVWVRDGDGRLVKETYYWVADFDDQYVYVVRNTWDVEGNSEEDNGRFKYFMNEEDMAASITSEFEPMVVRWLTLEENERLDQSRNAFESLTQEYEEYKNAHSFENSEVDELRKFRDKRLDEDHKIAINEVLAEFEDLCENEEFSVLTKDNNEVAYSFKDANDLREKCFAIRGKYNAPARFARQSKPNFVKIGLNSEDTTPSRYGNLFSMYG